MQAVTVLPSLMTALSGMADPRQPRGVRHPFSAILGLVLLGMVCRISDFAALGRWSKAHWHLIRRPLGFTRPRPPHPTTLSRTLAKFSLDELQDAFASWLQAILDDESLVAAVDGKTSKQGLNPDGNPLQMLNVFAQDLKACLGQWPIWGDKKTEPEVLKMHLAELFDKYPALRLITGDALYTQRNLAELIVQSGHDYLFQIKGNQPDILDAAQTCLGQAKDSEAAAVTREKRGAIPKLVFFGSTWTMPNMCETSWVLPVVASSSGSTGSAETVAAKCAARRGTSSVASTRPR
jgi:DDE_Tnp_1-associated